MLRASMRSVLGHKLRFLLTALSVVLGVAFVAGTLVLTDSIKATFDKLLSQGSADTAVVVRGDKVGVDQGFGGGRRQLPVTLAQTISSVPGVRSALPDLQGSAVLVGKDGTAVRNGGAPTLGFAGRPGDSTFVVSGGHLPTTADEIAVESATLDKSGLALGDTTRVVVGNDVRTVTVAGVVDFGKGVSLAGATAVLFDPASAQHYFAPDGSVDTITVKAAPGVSQEALRGRVAAVLPSGTEAITGKQSQQETKDSIGKALAFIDTFLLVFAGIALFVGAFIILNTFTMLVAQRTRELALLRALGASRGQVTRSVLGEALVVGLVSSVLGLLLGLGVASALKALLGSVGLKIGTSLPVAPRTVVAAFVIGIGVTMLAAFVPAWRGARIPPVAAMRDDVALPERSLHLRSIVGGIGAALGIVALIGGLVAGKAALVGLGAGLTFVGVTVLAPLIANPVVRVLALPYQRLFGTVGRLARENALRNPRRTSTTAAALMVGMALVSAVTILASSTKAATSSLVDQQLTASFVLTAGGQGQTMPETLATKAAAVPGVTAVAAVSTVPMRLAGKTLFGTAATADSLRRTVSMTMTAGSLDALGTGKLLVDANTARANHWSVGSSVPAVVGVSDPTTLTVGGIFASNPVIGSVLVPRPLYIAGVPAAQRGDSLVYVATGNGAAASIRAALTDLVKPYAIVSVEDRQQFKSAQATQIDTLLYIIYGLLGLAIVIAVLGIVNTLALSVFERTREIGLLRAVGLDRRRLKRTIRLESVLIAVFGAVFGTALGVFFAVCLQRTLKGKGLTVLSIPIGQLLAFLVVSGLVGILAAAWPARRAAKMDVLRAIVTE